MSARLEWHGPRVEAHLRDAAADGLTDAAEHLLGASRAVVPIEEATLERSGRAQTDRPALRAVVSYDTPYAVIQHEALEFQHDAGRQAKYLEEPAHAEAGAMTALIAARIRRALT